MKIKGNDGVTREFEDTNEKPWGMQPTRCLECGHRFGKKTIEEQKDRIKSHICDEDNLSFFRIIYDKKVKGRKTKSKT